MAGMEEDMDKFLNAVDEIAATVQDLAKNDCGEKTALENADKLIEKLEISQNGTINKTAINQDAFDNWSSSPSTNGPSAPNMAGGGDGGQAAFLAALEQDARERAERKKRNEETAMELKEKGNVCFREGRFQDAMDWYTKALDVYKNTTVLWTNRAQCRIQLEQYEQALEDCEWALRVSDDCVKGYFLKGKTLQMMKHFREAKECYAAGLEKTTGTSYSLLANCLKEVERSEKLYIEERDAEIKILKEKWKIMNFDEIIPRLKSIQDENPESYIGGIRVLKNIITGNTERVIFRLRGGLDLFHHPYILSILNKLPAKLKEDEMDLIKEFLELVQHVVEDCDENQCRTVDDEAFTKGLQSLMSATSRDVRYLQMGAVLILHKMRNNHTSCLKMTNAFSLDVLVNFLLNMINRRDSFTVTVLEIVAGLLQTKRFKNFMLLKSEKLVAALMGIMQDASMNLKALWRALDPIVQITGHREISVKLLHDVPFLDSCINVLQRHVNNKEESDGHAVIGMTLAEILQLTHNMDEHDFQVLKESLATLNKICWQIFCQKYINKHFLSSALHILGVTLIATPDVLEELAHVQLIEKLYKEGVPIDLGSAIKVIAICTKASNFCATHFCNLPNCIQFLMEHLKNPNDAVVGNVALIIISCTRIHGGRDNYSLAARLARTSILQELLVIARDSGRFKAQQNAAVAIGRLCQTDCRHITKLHDLDGMGILHSVLTKEKEEVNKANRLKENVSGKEGAKQA